MNVPFIIIAVFAVIAVSAVTIFVTPFDTTIPLPMPRETFKNNKNSTNSGVLLVAQNLEVPWAKNNRYPG
jgi:preprotein translocase subunit SecY